MQQIIGKNKLEKIFGHWPSFHDAEIHQIILCCCSKHDLYLPTLEAVIHVSGMNKKTGKNDYTKSVKHYLVTFVFSGIGELILENFNYQNVIFELKINELKNSENRDQKFKIEFDSSCGCYLSFCCNAIEIKSVKPYVS